MTDITVEAIYENGVLRPVQPLPLVDKERVTIAITGASPIQRAYGVMGWKGDSAMVQSVALNPEYGLSESP